MADPAAEFEACVTAFEAATTGPALTSALRDMHRVLSLNPSVRATVPKERIIEFCVRKRAAVSNVWNPETAQAFGDLLAVYATPVFPQPAYPGQAMPPPYLFTPPVAAAIDPPPAYTPSAPAPYDGGAGGAAGGAGGGGMGGDFKMPGGPALFYAPAPSVMVHSPEQQIALGVPVYETPPQEEYTLDFQDGVEKTTGELPCRPENLWRVAHINLWNNDVVSIVGLEKYPNLMRLTLRSNDIKTLSGIQAAPNLRWVDASDNDLRDLAGMSSLNSLEWLDLHNNDLPNLRGLSWCPRLTYLNLWHNDLKDLSGIETLPSLRHVNLSSNDLTHVKGLAHCKALEEVNLAENDLTDLPSVLALATCPRLRVLNLSGNKYNGKQAKQIQEHFRTHLPGCRLTIDGGRGGGGGCTVM